MLALNLDMESFFEEFVGMREDDIYDLEMLNRAIYHKILNEISLLKMITLGVIADEPTAQVSLTPLIDNIENVVAEIEQRRKNKDAVVEQKKQVLGMTEEAIEPAKDHNPATVAQISGASYQEVIAIISETAHHISDFVNNEMATIESEIRFILYDFPKDTALGKQLNKLLEQVELTQNALNDLKAINEGIQIKPSHFQVQELFEKFAKTARLESDNIATIQLDIQNGETLFYGDEPKIKSFLNELVANSLKHNAELAEITIKITSKDVTALPASLIKPMKARTSQIVTSQQKYLAIIYCDNGKGIPRENKTWILQPLTTTAKEEKGNLSGSGLGLFIIRKTLIEMGGYIIETGFNGARFEIYIPYQKEKY
jgi:signal transduction histidine kinase